MIFAVDLVELDVEGGRPVRAVGCEAEYHGTSALGEFEERVAFACEVIEVYLEGFDELGLHGRAFSRR